MTARRRPPPDTVAEREKPVPMEIELAPTLRAKLLAYCDYARETPAAVIADALALHLDEVEEAIADGRGKDLPPPCAQQQLVDAWNAAHPEEGVRVSYVRDDFSVTCAKTRSRAEMLSGHTAVIWLEGVRGCVALGRVKPLDNAVVIPAIFAARAIKSAIAKARGCFAAAEAEGLSVAIAETADERLRDLLTRRVLHADMALAEIGIEPEVG
jgi:hypothetical protein